MTRMPLTSADLLGERIDALKEIFPEVFTEGKVDFERLRLELGDDIETGPERFGLTWPGKAEAIRAIQTPSTGALIPQFEESVNFDTAQNLIIEGDNLEILKLLQKSYHGKVKMIYIDPPYNTGRNEFIYPDNFSRGLTEYLHYSGQTDDNGSRASTTSEGAGRYHSRWMSMMYPRLFLARNVLSENGVLFVSIDDNEVHNLRHLLDEIFGPENLVAQIPWQARTSVQNDTDVSINHEYIIGYARSRRIEHRRLKESNANDWFTFPTYAAYPLPLDKTRYDNPDNDARGPWKADPFDAPNIRPNLTYAIKNPVTEEEYWPPAGRCWRTDEKSYHRLLVDDRIVFGRHGTSRPQLKVFYKEKQAFGEVRTSWFDAATYGTATNGTHELQRLFEGVSPFSYPKPTQLLKALLQMSTRDGDLVLDFFAGSGTTAHATMDMNSEDRDNRKFILVQLPEPTDNPDFPTIVDITRERVRRVLARDSESDPLHKGGRNGFRAFKLTSSNFKIWDGNETPADAEGLARQLELYADHLIPGRTQQDILYELILKAGLELTVPVEEVAVESGTAYRVDGRNLLICLESPITEAMLRAIVALDPVQVICLDQAFGGNDQLKTNTVLEMQSRDITFRTV